MAKISELHFELVKHTMDEFPLQLVLISCAYNFTCRREVLVKQRGQYKPTGSSLRGENVCFRETNKNISKYNFIALNILDILEMVNYNELIQVNFVHTWYVYNEKCVIVNQGQVWVHSDCAFL